MVQGRLWRLSAGGFISLTWPQLPIGRTSFSVWVATAIPVCSGELDLVVPRLVDPDDGAYVVLLEAAQMVPKNDDIVFLIHLGLQQRG